MSPLFFWADPAQPDSNPSRAADSNPRCDAQHRRNSNPSQARSVAVAKRSVVVSTVLGSGRGTPDFAVTLGKGMVRRFDRRYGSSLLGVVFCVCSLLYVFFFFYKTLQKDPSKQPQNPKTSVWLPPPTRPRYPHGELQRNERSSILLLSPVEPHTGAVAPSATLVDFTRGVCNGGDGAMCLKQAGRQGNGCSRDQT